ncbi:MAG TPA: PAS domain-containing protein, partial [Bryobacteraceae bacterium]
MSLAETAATAERELRKRIACLENRVSAYERVFLENPVPAVVYAADSLRILEANDSALALYGYERQQLRSLSVTELFAPDTHRHRTDLKAELRKPLNSIGPLVHRGASKQELVVSLIIFAIEIEGR